MLCSFDPVALDEACRDLCAKEEAFSNSQLGEQQRKPGFKSTGDPFKDNDPEVNDDSALIHAEEIGLGTRNYELIKM